MIFWASLLRNFSTSSSEIGKKRLFQSSRSIDRSSSYGIAEDSRVGPALVMSMPHSQGMVMLFPAT